MPEDADAGAQPVGWALAAWPLPGAGHRGKNALRQRTASERQGGAGGDGLQRAARGCDGAVEGDWAWRTQDLHGAPPPSTQLAPSPPCAVADEAQRRDLVAHHAARNAVPQPPRQGKGDRRQIEQATGADRSGHHQQNRAAPLAGVTPTLDGKQRGRLERTRYAADLALTQAMTVQHNSAPDRTAPRSAHRTGRGTNCVDRRPMSDPGLDRKRTLDQPL